jgi:dihydroflavonol-4-reductase
VLVLITGSTGFIGSQLCRAALEAGHRVRAFHRPGSSLMGLTGLEVEHAVGDVTDRASLQAAMQEVAVVFHAAAMLGAPRDPRPMYRITVGGTENVLQAALEAGVQRVVHTSSVAALGVPELIPGAEPALLDERHTWNYPPAWWSYGHAKYLAELAVQRFVAQGLDVVLVNPAVVVGAGDLNRVSGDIILHVAKGHVPVSVPGGLNVVHIADVVQGHLAALHFGRRGQRYILGGENLTHRSFLDIIAAITGARPPRLTVPSGLTRFLSGPASALGRLLPLPVSPEMLRKAGYFFYYDTRKAQSELGLGEARSVWDSVTEAYRWYQEYDYAPS